MITLRVQIGRDLYPTRRSETTRTRVGAGFVRGVLAGRPEDITA
jgi:hypothetical protein